MIFNKLKKRNKSRFIPLPIDANGKQMTMFVNPSAITAFTPDYKGRELTHIAVNGNIYAIDLPIEKFIIKLKGYETEIQDQQG